MSRTLCTSKIAQFTVAAVLVSASACWVEQRRETAPPATPVAAPPPVVVAPPPVVCGPIGSWRMEGPAGGTQIEVGRGDGPDKFVVVHKGVLNGVGAGVYTGGELKIDMGAIASPYRCRVNDDCKTM